MSDPELNGVVNPGRMVVPIVPTEKMLAAAREMARRHDNGSEWISKFWRVMVHAAPDVPAVHSQVNSEPK